MKKSSKGFVTPYKDAASISSSVNPLKTTPKATTTVTPKAKTINKNENKSTLQTSSPSNTEESIYYYIDWCAKTTKKHKVYNDGYLKYDEPKKLISLYDDCGKEIGKNSIISVKDIQIDATLNISSKEVIIKNQLTSTEFEKATGLEYSLAAAANKDEETTTGKKTKTLPKKLLKKQEEKEEAQTPTTTTTTTTSTMKKEFKSHTSLEEQKMGKKIANLHDPNSKDALILYTPPESQIDEDGNKVVHVVLDPHITRLLRPHQRRGVKFLYDCVTGVSNNNGYTGAILADQMGLGKTLQTLALLWTLLKQSPYGKPMIKKAIIVTPSTLVNNWKNEIQKWFGTTRLIASTLTDTLSKETKANLNDFNTSIKPVLIISYEQCRIFSKELELMTCGLMVCDEAHRLKNSNAKTTQSINSVKADRKILLTGTPIQNDLVEFYSMVDFANPNCLGSLPDFKKNFINPINKSRETSGGNQSNSTSEGLKKAMQLSKLTKPFILRRKSNILEKYLPPKRVQVLFCSLSKLQIELYKSILNSNSVQSLLSGSGRGAGSSLTTITLLKKLCNSPSLLLGGNNEDNIEFQNIFKKYNYDGDSVMGGDVNENEAGKLIFVENLIKQVKPVGEKVVLVSNYTQTLDVFEKLCKRLSISTLRLDGSVNADHRQALIDKFNDTSKGCGYQVFLLSAKAGGVGINLIGGNHLVLYDPDWNPAIDIQAMERVWREGQVKPVFIYRLFSTGTIEEKIYQRQLMKESISNSIVDKKFNDNGGGFSLDDLKDIFSLNELTNSDTHDLLQCNCGNNSDHYNDIISNKSNSKVNQILKTIQHCDKWEHYKDSNHFIKHCKHDSILKKLKYQQLDPVSFIFISKNSIPLSDEELENDDNGSDEISFLETENSIQEDNGDDNEDTKEATPKKRSPSRKTKETEEKDDEEEEDDEPQLNTKRKRLKVNNFINDDDDGDLSDLDMS